MMHFCRIAGMTPLFFFFFFFFFFFLSSSSRRGPFWMANSGFAPLE
jgi:hypothetical protein